MDSNLKNILSLLNTSKAKDFSMVMDDESKIICSRGWWIETHDII